MITKIDETLSNDSIVHWSERDGRQVPITCGKCKEKRSINVPRGNKRSKMTGYCSSCRNGRVDEQKHSSGTIISWAERDPANHQKVAINCHGCDQKKFVWSTTAREMDWPGLCSDCILERGRPRKYTRDEKLPSGSIFHWTERDPENLRQVPVTCGTCGRKRTVLIGTRWRGTGLCHKCASKPFSHDEPVRKTGTIIHWGETDPNNPQRIMVTCGLCRNKRSFSKDALFTNYKKPKWTGYCRNRYECFQVHLTLKAQTQNGSEQQNGNRENIGGRPPAFTNNEAFDAVDKLGSRVSENQLAKTLKCSRPAVKNWWSKRMKYDSLDKLLEDYQSGRLKRDAGNPLLHAGNPLLQIDG